MNRTEYLLVTLSEECSEVSESVCRAIALGLEEIDHAKLKDNVRSLEQELADLVATAELLGLVIRDEDKVAGETGQLLTVLSEKCAKVSVRACKAARFGLKEIQPGQLEDNTRRLERELGVLVAVADLLKLKIRDEDKVAKRAKLEKFMAYSKEVGTLQ